VKNQNTALVIGIGNEYRSDDGIGLLIAREIYKKQLPFVIVKEESGEGASLMDAWQGFERVTLIDAVSSGAQPGKIVRIDANKEQVLVKYFHYSTHAFSVAEAVELARSMNSLPSELIIYGIEGSNFAAGVSITPIIREKADRVIEQIVEEVDVLNR
jgi:hydrogenase maturation protease